MITDKWNLPDTWAWATLADLTEIKGGVTVDKKRRPTDPVTLPYLRVANVQNGYLDLREVKEIVVDRDRAGKYFLRTGDILLNEGGDRDKLGRGWVWSGQIDPCIHQNHVFRARPVIPELSSKFISYYANAFGQPFFMQKGKQSVNLASISLTAISGLPAPVAPLAEQHRIVEKIETLFARLDKGEEALREVQKLLVRYRQSVLKAAVTGELTADWRAENVHRLEHGRDLLARILKTRREIWQGRSKYKEPAAPDTSDLPELPEGWVWASLGQLVAKIEAGKNFRCEERPPDGDETGIVKISAVTWDEFNEFESKTIFQPEQVNSALLIKEGDLLISRANTIELVGASVVVERIAKRLQLSDKVLRLCCVEPIEHWLNYVLKSPVGRKQIEERATGAQMSMRNISQKNLERIAVPLPPMEEMKAVVDELWHAHQQGDRLKNLCESERCRSGALRQSVLKDAFAGRLVPQNPSDEPAAALLARIKNAGAAAPKKSRRNVPAKVAS